MQTNKNTLSGFLIKNSIITSLATLVSRISGFIRDIIMAILFGATSGYDAYVLAFRIPNLMRRLFAEGAFSQAFVPVFAEYTGEKTPEETKLFLNNIAGNLVLILLIVTVLGITGSSWLVKLFAPGFVDNAVKMQTAVRMLQCTFPYILFISLTALSAGVLNCYNKFLVPAFTPVLLNISLIFSGLLLAKKCLIPEMSLAYGVLIAGFIQLLFQLPFLHKLNLLPNLTINWQDPGVKRVLLLIIPAIFGAAIGQINILVDSVFASFLETGSISWLYYSDRLMEFPLGMFGVSFATVLLPQLSRSFASKNNNQFSEILEWGIRTALLVGIPASMVLLFIPEQIVTTLFFRGKFSYYDVLMTSRSLMAYSFSVIGIMLVKIFSSGFYAKKDLKTPVKIGCCILILNIILNSIFTRYLAHMGIALATSIASIFHAILLCIILDRDLVKINIYFKSSYKLVLNLLVATIALALFLNFYPKDITYWITWSLYYKVFKLTEIFALAGAIYCGILWLMGVKLRNILVIN